MTKQRNIDTKFWADSWVRKLNPLDRYLFLYLLTNNHSSWCGVYELDLGVMAFETGIDERDLEKSMLPRLEEKLVYIDGWICFKNWEKYHDNGSKDTKKGLENAWKEVPEEIQLKLKEISKKDRPPIDPLPAPPSFTSSSSLTFTSSSKSSAPRTKKTTKYHQLSGEVLKAFEAVDPKIKTMYANTTQRKAASFLIEEYGIERVLKAISLLPSINQQNLYIAQITTPYELQQNWVKLGNAYRKKTNAQQESLSKVIW